MLSIPSTVVLAVTEGGAEEEGGSFLVEPGIGLMVWTLLVFFAAFLVLRKLAWPQITEALDKRQHAIEESIDTAERTKTEAARQRREELLEQTRRDIEAETRRAIQEIRGEVADLTVLATEKVTRKVLSEDDQRRLVAEALEELDFTTLAGDR